MPINMSGAGVLIKRDSDGNIQPLFASAFTLAETTEIQKSEGYPVNDIGIMQILDSVTTKSEWKLTLAIQSADDLDLTEWVFGQKKGTISSISVPVSVPGTIPTSGDYELTVTGLTLDQVVDITVLSDISPGKQYLEQVPSGGTLAANQYEVTANTITFHSGLAGRSVVCYYRKTESNLKSIGGTNALAYVGEFEMIGKFKYTRTLTRNIWLPRCKYATGVTIDPKGDSFSRELDVFVPTGWGWKLPYLEWETA